MSHNPRHSAAAVDERYEHNADVPSDDAGDVDDGIWWEHEPVITSIITRSSRSGLWIVIARVVWQ